MNEARQARIGKIEWFDLTVPDAQSLRNFYQQVAGWTSSGLSMGEYDDYCMAAKDGNVVAGVCHARGSNAGIPACWMMYINVDNLDASLDSCIAMGGAKLSEIRHMPGHGRYAIIRDPAGAVCALFEPEQSNAT